MMAGSAPVPLSALHITEPPRFCALWESSSLAAVAEALRDHTSTSTVEDIRSTGAGDGRRCRQIKGAQQLVMQHAKKKKKQNPEKQQQLQPDEQQQGEQQQQPQLQLEEQQAEQQQQQQQRQGEQRNQQQQPVSHGHDVWGLLELPELPYQPSDLANAAVAHACLLRRAEEHTLLMHRHVAQAVDVHPRTHVLHTGYIDSELDELVPAASSMERGLLQLFVSVSGREALSV